MYSEVNEKFHVNEYILHSSSGVCRVQDICVPGTRHADPSRICYRLLPVYEAGCVIYTPTDNSKTIVRRILSRDEAVRLVESIPFLEAVCIRSEKMREEQYRELLRTNSCREWVRMIKTLYLRKAARKSDGKPVMRTDEKYLHIAEDLLFGELAISLELSREHVSSLVAERIGNSPEKSHEDRRS